MRAEAVRWGHIRPSYMSSWRALSDSGVAGTAVWRWGGFVGGETGLPQLLVPSLNPWGPLICQAGVTTVPVHGVAARPAPICAQKALRPLLGPENCLPLSL